MRKITSIFVLLAMAVGLFLTVWGLSGLHASGAIPWPVATNHFLILVVYTIFIFIGMRIGGGNAAYTGMAISVCIAIIAGALWPLIVTVWFFVASAIVGRYISAILNLKAAFDNLAINFLLGAGLYGTVVGLLAHFPVNYPGVYGLALAAPVLIGWRSIQGLVFDCHNKIRQSSGFDLLEIAITLMLLLYLSLALMPEVGHDALATHLFVPAQLYYRHEWGYDVTTYVWAVMPMLGDWIYSLGYMLGGETAARMINVGFVFVLCKLIRDLVLWCGGNLKGARWAVLLFLTTPVIFLEASSLFIESVWGAFVVAGVMTVLKILQEDENKTENLFLSGIFLGAALAAKAVTLAVLPALLIVAVFYYRRWLNKEALQNLAVGIVLLLVIGLIPYVTAWSLTGNPVFPFFNEIFQSPLYLTENFSAPPMFEKGLSWDTIYRVTFESSKYLEATPGAAGFQWILLLLPSMFLFFALNKKGLLLVIVSVLAIAFTFHETAYLRYVYPSFALLSAAIGIFYSQLEVHGSQLLSRAVFMVMLLAVLLNMVFLKSGTYYGQILLPPLLSESGKEEYLQKRLPIRNAVSLVNKLNIASTPVVFFSSSLAGELSSDAVYPNWYNYKFQSSVNNAESSNDIAELVFDKGADFIILDKNWGDANKRELIYEATDVIQEFGAIAVRRIKTKYHFNIELLKDTDFSNKAVWTLVDEAKLVKEGVIVSVGSPAIQRVKITSKRRYKLAVVASCMQAQSQGRVQVNWVDASGLFISTDITVFDCDWSKNKHDLVVVSPSDAETAVVYAVGHTKEPIIIHEVSFK